MLHLAIDIPHIISVIGGLLSAHLLAARAGVKVEQSWPCDGPLLRLAVDVAERLLPGLVLFYCLNSAVLRGQQGSWALNLHTVVVLKSLSDYWLP